jgi:hypothetical protein
LSRFDGHHRLVVREVALDEPREDQRALGLELDLRLLDRERDLLVLLAQDLVEQVHRLRGHDDADVLLALDLARRLALDVGEPLAVARHHPDFLALDLEELAGQRVADDLGRDRELRLADHRPQVLGRDLDRGLVLERGNGREVGGVDADDLERRVGQRMWARLPSESIATSWSPASRRMPAMRAAGRTSVPSSLTSVAGIVSFSPNSRSVQAISSVPPPFSLWAVSLTLVMAGMVVRCGTTMEAMENAS